jgi:hypothetical protein
MELELLSPSQKRQQQRAKRRSSKSPTALLRSPAPSAGMSLEQSVSFVKLFRAGTVAILVLLLAVALLSRPPPETEPVPDPQCLARVEVSW